jgi:hypothetical protein
MEHLYSLEDRPWSEWNDNAYGITQRQIASILHQFGIRPGNLKMPGGKVPKGYLVQDFNEVFVRFLPAEADSSRYSATEPENSGNSVSTQPLPQALPHPRPGSSHCFGTRNAFYARERTTIWPAVALNAALPRALA